MTERNKSSELFWWYTLFCLKVSIAVFFFFCFFVFLFFCFLFLSFVLIFYLRKCQTNVVPGNARNFATSRTHRKTQWQGPITLNVHAFHLFFVTLFTHVNTVGPKWRSKLFSAWVFVLRREFFCCFSEDGEEMYKVLKCTCWAILLIFFFVFRPPRWSL